MKTVFVGLSGGVDSAVSAYLLKNQGYRVVGAFIKGWEPDFLPCTGTEDRLSAMRVAAHLGIPFLTIDLEKEYKRDVVDYFVKEYRVGRTPNPDVMCNRVIKFGAFSKKVKMLGADYIATGHYAVGEESTGGYKLRMSADEEKDQTYFLWTLNQDDLSHVLFPVGGLKKPQVREIATRAGLPNASRKDSQGLCFLGHVDMREFLKRYLPTKVGMIYHTGGELVGEHEGVWFYTLGQHLSNGGHERRLYVVKKDIKKNILTVSEHPRADEAARAFKFTDVNWITGSQPKGEIRARYRYRQPLIPVQVSRNSVHFQKPELIASGQSVVFYDNKDSCIGGGIVL